MIFVIKRNGDTEELMLEKWQTQIATVCSGIPDVSQSMIEINSQLHFYNNITTKEIDEITLRAIVDLIDVSINPELGNTNYQFVAGKHRLSMLRKDVYGKYTPPPLFDIVVKNVGTLLYTSELLDWYTKEEWEQMESFINHKKDEAYSYAAIEQMIEKYLVRNRATGQVYETPQVRYIVAAATKFHMEPKETRMRLVKEYYDVVSNGDITMATPGLAGLGTPTKQFSSCVKIKVGDSLDSIFASGQVMARYASKRAGIGLDVSRIRPLGAPIRNGEIKHTGLVPFLKKLQYDLKSTSQGGIRSASCTVFYELWHYQFEDLIVLKNNQGTDETRVRHMDYGVVLCNLFWQRFKRKEMISFFDPNDVPELYEAFYRDINLFNKLYVEYESRVDIKRKTMSADEVFKSGVLKERSDTNRIYLLNIDNVQRHCPFDSLITPVYQSNLCLEITIPTVEFESLDDVRGRIALCTLGSINWGAYKHPTEMKRACELIVRGLDNLLSYQDFLSIQSVLGNDDFRPLGVGITNLAYFLAKRNLKYGSPEGLAEVKRWIEHQTFYLLSASVALAKERGACGLSHTTKYAKGIFPWELRPDSVNELTDFTPDPSLDWESLRNDMKTYGVRNAVVSACPPVESSSVVINSTNGIEMPLSLIQVKDSKAGSLVQVVPDYQKLKTKYQLLWDQDDCLPYLKTCAVLAAYVDQAISVNTFYNPSRYPDNKIPATVMAKNIMLGSKWGIKSFYYNRMPKQRLITDDAVTSDTEEVCESCVL